MTITGQANRWYMAGTQGTGEYRVLAYGKYGRIGVRVLDDDTVRVRIEPTNEQTAAILARNFPADKGWKQYGEEGQSRFSKVYDKDDPTLSKTIRRAITALGPLMSRRYNWRHLKLVFGRL